jgi:hypothetical protein
MNTKAKVPKNCNFFSIKDIGEDRTVKIPKIRISYPSTYPAQKSDRGISFFTIFG